jgi:hypothetical protein
MSQAFTLLKTNFSPDVSVFLVTHELLHVILLLILQLFFFVILDVAGVLTIAGITNAALKKLISIPLVTNNYLVRLTSYCFLKGAQV